MCELTASSSAAAWPKLVVRRVMLLMKDSMIADGSARNVGTSKNITRKLTTFEMPRAS